MFLDFETLQRPFTVPADVDSVDQSCVKTTRTGTENKAVMKTRWWKNCASVGARTLSPQMREWLDGGSVVHRADRS